MPTLPQAQQEQQQKQIKQQSRQQINMINLPHAVRRAIYHAAQQMQSLPPFLLSCSLHSLSLCVYSAVVRLPLRVSASNRLNKFRINYAIVEEQYFFSASCRRGRPRLTH